MRTEVVAFDMDGVLVDPTETFRKALIETVEHFSGVRMTQDEIVKIKNEGGYNNDHDIAVMAIRAAGMPADPDEVFAYGKALYWGRDGDGLISNERWLAAPGLLERVASGRGLAIFTGRGAATARHTLDRFCPQVLFEPVVTNELVERHKPAPDGLLLIRGDLPGASVVFVGDNVDDCRSAAAAGVRFLGVASPGAPRHRETATLFRQLGAEAVLASVNEIEAHL